MREMSASEASRTFSAVLDSAEHGETIVVTRGGRRIAAITPIPRGNGAALREVFDRWRGVNALDETLLANVSAARESADASMDADPWHD